MRKSEWTSQRIEKAMLSCFTHKLSQLAPRAAPGGRSAPPGPPKRPGRWIAQGRPRAVLNFFRLRRLTTLIAMGGKFCGLSYGSGV
jgi:hypothetical protein